MPDSLAAMSPSRFSRTPTQELYMRVKSVSIFMARHWMSTSLRFGFMAYRATDNSYTLLQLSIYTCTLAVDKYYHVPQMGG